jgi:glutaredoxin
MKRFLFLCSIFMLTTAHAGGLYRYIDNNGRVQYSDKPNADAERLKLGNEPVVEDTLPYATQKANQAFPVTLYVFEKCGAVCSDARELLKTRGIPFTEKNLATSEDLDAYRKASGTDKAPSMLVGKTWVKGFLAEQWHADLDFAGYPKTAPYRAKPTNP